MTMQSQGKLDRDWGFEIIWANNEKYCGKMLVFKSAGAKTNLVLHKEKRKSWFINAGKFKLTYIDVKTGIMNEATLEEGKTVDLAELSPHQVEALVDGSMIFEVSTTDHIEDVINLSPSAAQTPPPSPQ
jgi:hypothetical protein